MTSFRRGHFFRGFENREDDEKPCRKNSSENTHSLLPGTTGSDFSRDHRPSAYEGFPDFRQQAGSEERVCNCFI